MIEPKHRRHPVTGKRPRAEDATGVRYGGSTGFVGFFGLTRDDGRKEHKGIDFLAPKGAPVYAAHDGVITRDGEQSGGKGYGLRLYLTAADDDGTETRYAHLSGQTVRCGAKVRRGALLGWSGDSGNVDDGTPDHLHFEVRIAEAPVDPLEWLRGKV
jgi:murein DD-endopeptidase MepM/ murein hydrolase activator NlpD